MTVSLPAVSQTAGSKVDLTERYCGLLIAVYVAMRIWRIDEFSLDGDEIFSVLLARDTWPNLFNRAVQDAIHPPFFYVLLKGWMWIGGESLMWLRLLPVAISVACLIPAFALCRKLGVSAGARNLALAMVAVHPIDVYYAQHVRMYSLLALVALISTWCFERYLDQPSARRLAVLTLVNVFLVYTQYYGWFIVALEFLYFVWRKRRFWAIGISVLITAILFSPWAVLAGRVLRGRGLEQNLGWLTKPKIGELCWFFVDLTGFAEFPKIGILGSVVVLIFLVMIYRRGVDSGFHWLTVLWVAPPIIAFAVSNVMSKSIWGHRHMVFTVWPFVLVFADSIWRLGRVARVFSVTLISGWVICAAAFHATDDRKLPWDALTIEILKAEQSGAARIPLYSVDPYLHFPIWFYMECLKTGQTGPIGPHIGKNDDVPALAARARAFDIIKSPNLDKAVEPHFWVGFTDSSWPDKNKTARQIIEEKGCRAGPDFKARDRFHGAVLFPVECPAAR